MQTGEEHVLSPTLNSITCARKAGCLTDNVVKTASEFFSEEKIMEARELLRSRATNTRLKDCKISENVFDIVCSLDKYDEKKVDLPKFVTFEPDEVPFVSGKIAATLTRKVCV